jgi:hypothetical protein
MFLGFTNLFLMARESFFNLETAIEMRKNVGNSHMAGLCANLAHSPDW